MSKMNEVFKKVLNDRDIFYSPYDKKKHEPIPILFEKDLWAELRKLFEKRQKEEFNEKIDDRIKEIEKQEQNIQNKNLWRLKQIEELKKRAEWVKSAFDEKPYLLKNLFENLEWWSGLVECKLPNMDDFGAVIENYDISVVEQYFLDKMNRASSSQERALKKVLGYLMELYSAGIPPEVIAYFVRKLNSLTKYWEVIKK